METEVPSRSNVFKYNLFALHIFGLWSFSPDGSRRSWYTLYSVTMISLFGLFTVTCLVSFFFILDDMANVANTLSVSFTNITNFIKMIPLLFQSGKLRALINNLETHLYPQGRRDQRQEKDILIQKVQRNGLVRQLLYMSLFLSTTVMACYRPMLQEDTIRSQNNSTSTAGNAKTLPFVAWFPYSYEHSPFYEVTYVFQSISSVVDSMQAASMDLFYLALVAHTTALFQILKVSLQNVHKTASQRIANGPESEDESKEHHELDNGCPDLRMKPTARLEVTRDINRDNLHLSQGPEIGKEMVVCLNECIRYHQDILRYAEEVRKLLSPLMLAECINITVILCMITFHATSFPLGSVGFLNILSFFMCEMLQLLQYCWFGSNLLWESSAVKDAVYESKWYMSPPTFRRSVNIIMLKAQKPVVINALFFSTITLDVFSVLLRASYSYYAVLRQLDNS